MSESCDVVDNKKKTPQDQRSRHDEAEDVGDNAPKMCFQCFVVFGVEIVALELRVALTWCVREVVNGSEKILIV